MNAEETIETLHILIVEDNPEDVYIYRWMLEQIRPVKCHITDVSTGEEGLNYLETRKVDCVLLDYRLPDMDGLEFLSDLNGNGESGIFPVILLTGQGDEQVAVQAMKSGASDYLIKGSLNSDLLHRAIVFAIDQTKRIRERNRYHAFLELLIDTVPNPMFFKNREGVFTGCNRAFATLVGKLKREVVGDNGRNLFSRELSDTFREMEKSLMGEDSIERWEITIPDADGRTREMICYLARFEEIISAQEGIVGILLDITTLKETESRLLRTQKDLETTIDQLEEANQRIITQQKSVIEEERLKVLLQMAGATSYELNQPMTVLLESIEHIQNIPEVNTPHLENIRTSGRQIAEIVQKIQHIRPDYSVEIPGMHRHAELNHPITILSVEDSRSDRLLLEQFVKKIEGIHLLQAGSMADAMDSIRSNEIDMIFLDYTLPDGNGLDFMQILHLKQIDIPVVFITGQRDGIVVARCIQAGALDYIPKGQITRDSLTETINNTMEKSRLQRDRKRLTDRLTRMAVRDELTGLFNRRYFNESLEKEMERTKRYGNALTMAIFDLDHFKRINDGYGHTAGDLVLKDIGKIISDSIRKTDVACRYGGEEVAVIMPETNIIGGAMVCERIRSRIEKHVIDFRGKHIKVTISAGLAFLNPDDQSNVNEFIHKTDHLLYRAKEEGRNRVMVEPEEANDKTLSNKNPV